MPEETKPHIVKSHDISLAGLNEKEVQFIRDIVLSVIDNMKLIKN